MRIEPTNPAIWGERDAAAFLISRQAVLSPRQVQPAHTQIIDLSGSDDEILKGMKSNNRNLHRNIHKKGVSIEVSEDPEDMAVLYQFLEATADRNGFNRQRDEYLSQVARVLMPAKAASLYIARLTHEDGTVEPIAAAFVYDSDDTRTYAHAAASFEHRKLSAGIPVVTNLILDAKAKGLKYVDLFGIAPEGEPDHEWAGFTKFKKSFGGESVTYPGTWDVPVNTAGYKVYDTAYRARPKAQQALAQTKKTREGRPRTFEETLETIKPLRKSFNGPPYHLTVPPGFRLFGAAVTLRQTAGTVPYTFFVFRCMGVYGRSQPREYLHRCGC